jgi:hypothetical protein
MHDMALVARESDVGSTNGMVGPNFQTVKGGGLSTNTSEAKMIYMLNVNPGFKGKEGAVGKLDIRILPALGLALTPDLANPGHYQITAGRDMKMADYIQKLNSLPWQPVYRKL